ncbi:hypothetical protein O9992_16365 [Vibrio lentus]|nr:hypothetical protein [Vibrio lentus]
MNDIILFTLARRSLPGNRSTSPVLPGIPKVIARVLKRSKVTADVVTNPRIRKKF